MKYVFKLIEIPESTLPNVQSCEFFKISLPKGSTVLRISRCKEDYMYIMYPKDMLNTEEEVSLFMFSDVSGTLGEKTVDIPEDMEFYPIDVCGMGPAIILGLKKK